MQGSGEKLTIAEFAARAGCTTQRVYQLLQNTLQPFAIVENGRKYIFSDGLQVVLDARKKQGFTKSLQENLQTVAKDLPTVSSQDLQAKIDELTAELDRCRADSKAKAAELLQTQADLEKTANELKVTRADLAAAREQREAAERKAAAADAERKRADAAEQQCTAKDKQLDAMQKQIDSITAALQREQEHAAELMQALAASQALHAGQLRLQMQDGEPEPEQPADQTGIEPEKRPGFFARLFHR